MEDDYPDENIDDSEEESSSCRECEQYQQRIYELNARLHGKLTDREYQETKQRLDDLVQMQLKHQREHL
jgi:hypothetical protein